MGIEGPLHPGEAQSSRSEAVKGEPTELQRAFGMGEPRREPIPPVPVGDPTKDQVTPRRPRSPVQRVDDIVAAINAAEEGLDEKIEYHRRGLGSRIPQYHEPLPEPAQGGLPALANRIIGSQAEEIAEKIRKLPEEPPGK